VRRAIPRKTPICRAIDMRERRIRNGMTAEEFAEILDVSDSKHVSAIEAQRCSVTMQRAIRAAYGLGAVIVELDGVGQAIVTPFCAEEDSRESVCGDSMRPGEAAWNVKEEAFEALECVKRLQKAVSHGDREELVLLCEQIICDPRHAVDLLAESIDEIDPTIMIEAHIRHTKKLAGKGIPIRPKKPEEAA
jgi:transcriptional regulator with XRE-family HTH domain